MTSEAKRARRRAWRSIYRPGAELNHEFSRAQREAARWGISEHEFDINWGNAQAFNELVRDRRRVAYSASRDLLAVRVAVLSKGDRLGHPRLDLVRYLVSMGEQLPDGTPLQLALWALGAARRSARTLALDRRR